MWTKGNEGRRVQEGGEGVEDNAVDVLRVLFGESVHRELEEGAPLMTYWGGGRWRV